MSGKNIQERMKRERKEREAKALEDARGKREVGKATSSKAPEERQSPRFVPTSSQQAQPGYASRDEKRRKRYEEGLARQNEDSALTTLGLVADILTSVTDTSSDSSSSASFDSGGGESGGGGASGDW